MLFLMRDVNVKNVKGNSHNVKKQKFEFAPTNKVVGMYKYLVNCTQEPSASQFDLLKEVFPCVDVECGLANFYDVESIGIKDEDSLY